MTSAADDKDAIREVMARYCHALDARRFAEVARLFAEDGEWTTTYGRARGRPEIAAQLDSVVPKPGEGPQRKHYITNIVITLADDTASAVSDTHVTRESETGLIPAMGGTCRDRFVKRDGAWLFASKGLVHDIVGNMALENNH